MHSAMMHSKASRTASLPQVKKHGKSWKYSQLKMVENGGLCETYQYDKIRQIEALNKLHRGPVLAYKLRVDSYTNLTE